MPLRMSVQWDERSHAKVKVVVRALRSFGAAGQRSFAVVVTSSVAARDTSMRRFLLLKSSADALRVRTKLAYELYGFSRSLMAPRTAFAYVHFGTSGYGIYEVVELASEALADVEKQKEVRFPYFTHQFVFFLVRFIN